MRHSIRFSFAVLGLLVTVWFGGCASTPPERPDSEKIKQDADEAFEDLQREENRTPDDY